MLLHLASGLLSPKIFDLPLPKISPMYMPAALGFGFSITSSLVNSGGGIDYRVVAASGGLAMRAGGDSKYHISAFGSGCAVNDPKLCDQCIKIHHSAWLPKSLKPSDLTFTNTESCTVLGLFSHYTQICST